MNENLVPLALATVSLIGWTWVAMRHWRSAPLRSLILWMVSLGMFLVSLGVFLEVRDVPAYVASWNRGVMSFGAIAVLIRTAGQRRTSE